MRLPGSYLWSQSSEDLAGLFSRSDAVPRRRFALLDGHIISTKTQLCLLFSINASTNVSMLTCPLSLVHGMCLLVKLTVFVYERAGKVERIAQSSHIKIWASWRV